MMVASVVLVALCWGAVLCQDNGDGNEVDMLAADVLHPCLQVPNPCGAHGDCTTIDNGYRCECDEEWTGPRCNIPNPCSHDVCQHGALCNKLYRPPWFRCTCYPYYYGEYCEYEPCDNHDCVEGVCIPTGYSENEYECLCHRGFTGHTCAKPLPGPCVDDPCFPGTCVERENDYYCICPAGFVGDIACREEHPCVPNPCLNGGLCWGAPGHDYGCHCINAYYGDHCENHPCEPNPCLHDGECQPVDAASVAGYQCRCTQGRYGDHCQNHPCDLEPCENDGTCKPSLNGEGYVCACTPGYSGPDCQHSDPCSSSPCLNGGTCHREGEDFTCHCNNQLYYGRHCQIPIDCDECLYDADRAKGYLVNAVNCGKYMVCVKYGNHYIVYHYTCPSGTAWNQQHLTCVHNEHCTQQSHPTTTATTTTTTSEPHPCLYDIFPGDETKYIVHFAGMEYVQSCPPGTVYDHSICTCVHDGNTDPRGNICLILAVLVTSTYNYPVDMPEWSHVPFMSSVPDPDFSEGTVFTGSNYKKVEYFNNWFDMTDSNQIRGVVMYLMLADDTVPYQGVLSNADCDHRSSIRLVIRDGMLFGAVDTTDQALLEVGGLSLTLGVWYWVRLEHNRSTGHLELSKDHYLNDEDIHDFAANSINFATGYIENRHCAITLGRIVDDSGEHYFTGEIQNVGFYRC